MNIFIKPLRYLTIAFYFGILLSSCQKTNKIEPSFTFPEIRDTLPKSDFYFSPQRQWYQRTYIHQINEISENVDFNAPFIRYINPFQDIDSIYQISTKTTDLHIYVDTTQEVSILLDEFSPMPYPNFIDIKKRIYKKYIPSHIDSVVDTLMWKDALKFYRYIKNVRGYPVYIVNSTDSNIVVNNIARRLEILQEAKDSKNKWRPIEHFDYWNCDFCFNTPIILEPNHYIFSKIYKYTGNYRTMIRLKFRNGSTIIYSNPFYGYINEAQLKLSDSISEEILKQLYIIEDTEK